MVRLYAVFCVFREVEFVCLHCRTHEQNHVRGSAELFNGSGLVNAEQEETNDIFPNILWLFQPVTVGQMKFFAANFTRVRVCVVVPNHVRMKGADRMKTLFTFFAMMAFCAGCIRPDVIFVSFARVSETTLTYVARH